MKVIKRGDIYWANLEPIFGHEIGKIRPTLVVSNNIQNQNLVQLLLFSQSLRLWIRFIPLNFLLN